MTDTYRTPLLTARETARHLRMPESTLDDWLTSGPEPLVHAVRPERRGGPRVPFVGVVEAYVLRSLRGLGMSMRDVRRAAGLVRDEFGDPYALARERVATDGVRLFVRLADDSSVRVRDDQLTLEPVIGRFLGHISWDDAGNPVSLRLPQYPHDVPVVIDPRLGGEPVLATGRTPVAALVGRWRAGATMAQVAEEFGLAVRAVEDVLRQAA